MKTYSQYNQDKWLFENIFPDKENGVFIEIGADDGIDKSNTKLFEELGWTGLCIEASPARYKLLEKNRNCICENVAVSDRDGECDFLDIAGYGKGLSGLVDKYDPAHQQRIKLEIQNPGNNGAEVIKVKTTTLQSLLEKHNISKIDFCSIDTEGSEEQIIHAIDFSKVSIEVLLIENNYNNTSITKFLESVGYKKIKKLHIDDVYKII